jgi:hypothetical protein
MGSAAQQQHQRQLLPAAPVLPAAAVQAQVLPLLVAKAASTARQAKAAQPERQQLSLLSQLHRHPTRRPKAINSSSSSSRRQQLLPTHLRLPTLSRELQQQQQQERAEQLNLLVRQLNPNQSVAERRCQQLRRLARLPGSEQVSSSRSQRLLQGQAQEVELELQLELLLLLLLRGHMAGRQPKGVNRASQGLQQWHWQDSILMVVVVQQQQQQQMDLQAGRSSISCCQCPLPLPLHRCRSSSHPTLKLPRCLILAPHLQRHMQLLEQQLARSRSLSSSSSRRCLLLVLMSDQQWLLH